jgi:AraC-like DNA-binding protein
MTLLCQPFPLPAGRRAQAWRYEPASRRPAHFHDQAELNLVVRGSAIFLVGHQRVPMRAGAVLWYLPGVDHYLEQASRDLELHSVGFEPELLDAFAREHGHALEFARPLQQLEGAALAACAAAFALAPTSDDNAAVEQRLLEVVATLPPPERRSPGLGRRAAAELLRDAALGRDELTQRLATNRGDLSRKFRQELGLSLTEYKNRLYTLKLVALLDRGHESVTHAAFEAGFRSYSRCHQVIRELLGISPRELRDPAIRRELATRLQPFPSPTLVPPSDES